MKLTYFNKSTIFCLAFLFFSHVFFAQSEYDKWVFGLGANAVDFFPFETAGNGNNGGFFNEVTNAADHWNVGGPKVHATRHIWEGLSIEGAFSFCTLTRFGSVETDKTTYTSFDVNAQYALLNPENSFNIALSVGGGYAGGYHSGGTLNLGGNLNWWFSDSLGLNVQGLVKYNSPDYSLEPHMFYGFSLVYRPNRGGFGSGKRYRWRNGR